MLWSRLYPQHPIHAFENWSLGPGANVNGASTGIQVSRLSPKLSLWYLCGPHTQARNRAQLCSPLQLLFLLPPLPFFLLRTRPLTSASTPASVGHLLLSVYRSD